MKAARDFDRTLKSQRLKRTTTVVLQHKLCQYRSLQLLPKR